MRALRNTERVLNNAGVERLIEIEREKGASLVIADILDEVAGIYPRVMIDGDMDAGAWSCGMVAGLIHDIPTVKRADRPDHAGCRAPDQGAAARIARRCRARAKTRGRLIGLQPGSAADLFSEWR